VSADSSASTDSIGGVPTRALPMPADASYDSSMANGRAWPCQPVSGWSNAARCRDATYTNAGAPGPPLRYL
jgi:hypothetical protein